MAGNGASGFSGACSAARCCGSFFQSLSALWASADARTKPGRWALGTAHAIAHITIILALVSLLPPANAWVLVHTPIGKLCSGMVFTRHARLLFPFCDRDDFIGGLAGGFVWGIYLLLTCITVGIHDNEAFSAMRLGLYRHFLRLRIKGDELTIYPISIDHPARSGWQWNEARKKGDQNQPEVIPKEPLKPRLIEGPIVNMIHRSQGRKGCSEAAFISADSILEAAESRIAPA